MAVKNVNIISNYYHVHKFVIWQKSVKCDATIISNLRPVRWTKAHV